MLKKCTKCGKEGDFYKDAQKHDGLDSWCKPCRKLSSSTTRHNHIDAVRAYDRGRRHAKFLAGKEKQYAAAKKWCKKNAVKIKGQVRRRNYKKRSRLYGLKHEEFLAMLILQGYRCQICLLSIPERKDQHIDHDHKTKVVRGILCQKCNRGLGHFNDNSDLLELAAAYLRGYRETF